MPENFDEDRAIALMDQGIAPLMGLETALAALQAAQVRPAQAGWRPWAPIIRDETLSLMPENVAKALLQQAGVAVPHGVSAPALPILRQLAKALRPPIALKGLGFAHKTEAGAVRLNLSSLDDQAEMPDANGYLAEEMVTGALAELIVGVRRDPVYGATLTLGFGGIAAELLADTVTVVLPCSGTDVEAALRSLRLWPLLDGYRGRPCADVAAVVRVAMALQGVLNDDPFLEEIEINPLMVRETGAVAADAVIWKDAT